MVPSHFVLILVDPVMKWHLILQLSRTNTKRLQNPGDIVRHNRRTKMVHFTWCTKMGISTGYPQQILELKLFYWFIPMDYYSIMVANDWIL